MPLMKAGRFKVKTGPGQALAGLAKPADPWEAGCLSREDHMRHFIAAMLVCTALATPASAALSGYYDSAEKISTILSSSAVADAVRQAPVGSISNTGTRKDGASEWQVRTQECDLLVYLIPVLPDGPGKTTYKLEVPGRCE